MPIADTDPSTPLSDTFKIVPGTYRFTARGDGFGAARFTAQVKPGQLRDLAVSMPRNLASVSSSATVTGTGTDLGNLIDDTEATQWTATGRVKVTWPDGDGLRWPCVAAGSEVL